VRIDCSQADPECAEEKGIFDENTGLLSPGEATCKFGTTEKAVMK